MSFVRKEQNVPTTVYSHGNHTQIHIHNHTVRKTTLLWCVLVQQNKDVFLGGVFSTITRSLEPMQRNKDLKKKSVMAERD